MPSYKLNDEKMFADVADGIVIIINSETGVYYGMNSFGTMIYEYLIQGVSTEQILESLKTLNGFVVDSFSAYLNFLVENEIILKIQDINPDISVIFDEAIAKSDNYIPEVKEYLDAQELLLADPIHEVKEEEGWTPEKSSLNEDKEDVARREAKMGIKN